MFGLQPKLSRERAEKLVRQGKTAAAIEVYEQLLETDHGNSNLIMPLGDLYARAGRNSDAARLFRGLAERLDSEGYHGRAAALWRKILKFEPDSTESELRLARSLLAQGSRVEAAAALHQVIERVGQHRLWKAAAEAYTLLAQAETPQAETCLHWGRALAQAGEQDQAQARLLAGLELATTAQKPQLTLAASLLQELERIDPRWPPYRLARAELAAWSGDAAGVLKWLPEPGSLPDAATAARAWRLAAKSGDLDLAGSWARAAIESGADETARDFGQLLLESGNGDRLTAWVCDSELLRREALRPHWLALFETWSQRSDIPTPALQAWLNLVAGRDAVLEAQLRLRLAQPAETKCNDSSPKPAAVNQAPVHAIAIESKAADIIAEVDAPIAAIAFETKPEIPSPPIAPSPPATEPEAALKTGFDSDAEETVIELDLSQPWTDIETDSEDAAAETISHTAADVVSTVNADTGSHRVESSSEGRAGAEAETVAKVTPDVIHEMGAEAIADLGADANAGTGSESNAALDVISNAASEVVPDAIADVVPDAVIDLISETAAGTDSDAVTDLLSRAATEEIQSIHAGVTPDADGVPDIINDLIPDTPAEAGSDVFEAISDAVSDVNSEAIGGSDAEIAADLISEATAKPDSEADIEVISEAATDEITGANAAADFDRVLHLISDAQQAEAPPITQSQPKPAVPAAMDLQPQPMVTAVPADTIVPAASPALPQPVVSFASTPVADPFLQDLARELNGSPDPLPLAPPTGPGANGTMRQAPTVTTEVLAGVLAEFERSLPENSGQPSSAEQHMHTGMALREMGLWEEAIAELQRAHNAWPPASEYDAQRRTCAAYLGECFTRLELPESALPWYRRVLADPAIPKAAWQGAAYETAAVLEQLGEFPEAARLLQQIYAENVDFLDVGERLRRLRSRPAAATTV